MPRVLQLLAHTAVVVGFVSQGPAQDRVQEKPAESRPDKTDVDKAHLQGALRAAAKARESHDCATAFLAYERVFQASPALLKDLSIQHWYDASWCAVLACTARRRLGNQRQGNQRQGDQRQGNQGRQLRGKDRDRALTKAETWLRVCLAQAKDRMDMGPSMARATEQEMSSWREEPCLAHVCDKNKLAKLPEPHREAWTRFWADVEQVREAAGRKAGEGQAVVDRLCSEADALNKKNDLDGAIRCYRKAIETDPWNARLHTFVGLMLVYKHDRNSAMLWFERALEIDPRFAPAYSNIGLVHGMTSNHVAAMRAYEKAVELDPNLATPRYNLGFTLMHLGRYEQALVHLRRACELCKDEKRLAYYKEMVDLAESELPRQRHLLRIAEGKLDPKDSTEVVRAANAAYGMERYGAALKTYDRAFVLDRKLLDDMRAGHRYNAACCAALVAMGRGKDARKLKADARRTLRQRALAWLREDLEYWRKQVDGDANVLRDAAYVLTHMLDDSDFDGMRGAALAELPEKERLAWQALWAELDRILNQVQDKRRGKVDRTGPHHRVATGQNPIVPSPPALNAPDENGGPNNEFSSDIACW